jgi:hypothetical protein
METKHTKGQWVINTTKKHLDGNGLSITNDRGVLIAKVSHDLTDKDIYEYQANALLINAAPIGLQVAINTYISILQTPSEIWRIKNQQIYIELREFISKATGYNSQYVQEFYEQVALLIKHKGVSQEEAIKKASIYEYDSKN